MEHTTAADDRFLELVADEHPGLVAAAAMVVGSREVAEEIVQDALERTYLRWSKVSRMDRPGAWVRRVVLNRSISHARRNGAERRALDRLRRRPARVAEPPGEPSGQLWEAVRRLPDKQARAVALHYGADLPIAGVAAELGVTESAAKTLLHRARGTLREDAAVRGHAGIEEAVQ